MFRNKWILIFTILIMVTGCVTVNIPEAYNFKVKELQNNPYGCWTEIVNDATSFPVKKFSGELLNLSADSAFLLIADGEVRSIENTSIISANLYTHKNQANTYITTSVLFASPAILGAMIHSDYGGGFLILGVPVALVGLVQSLIEGNKKRNILVYPQKNSLDDLAVFARYPAGMPQNIDISLLQLKK